MQRKHELAMKAWNKWFFEGNQGSTRSFDPMLTFVRGYDNGMATSMVWAAKWIKQHYGEDISKSFLHDADDFYNKDRKTEK